VHKTSTLLKDHSMGYKETYRALLALAAGQGGYFTAHQALAIGYSYPEQHYHATHDNWRKCARGVYLLRDYPASPVGDLIVLTLQSRDRRGQPQAVVSHETALGLHELDDANPAQMHLTVPPRFRGQLGPGVILHRRALAAQHWQDWGGYRVTTPLRMLVDIAASPTSWPLLEQAVRVALARGLVRRTPLLDAEGSSAMRQRLREAVVRATTHPHTRQEAGV
jgi:predicted transcriptional regulator of viral defense system